MLYKPNFCAECGEKINRRVQSLFASRKFCDDCARIFENPSRIKKAIVAGVIFIGGILAGQIGQTTKQAVIMTSAKPQTFSTATNQSSVAKANTQNQSLTATIANQNGNASSSAQQTSSKTTANPSLNTATSLSAQAPEESKSYCGAKTQKGTPCTRRAKSGQRCWQHAGKPAMLPPDKLLIR